MIQNTLSRQAVFTLSIFFSSFALFLLFSLCFVDFLFKLRYESRQHYRYDSAYLTLHSVIYSFSVCVSVAMKPSILLECHIAKYPVPQWKMCNVLNSCVPFARFNFFFYSFSISFTMLHTYTQANNGRNTLIQTHTQSQRVLFFPFFILIA